MCLRATTYPPTSLRNDCVNRLYAVRRFLVRDRAVLYDLDTGTPDVTPN